ERPRRYDNAQPEDGRTKRPIIRPVRQVLLKCASSDAVIAVALQIPVRKGVLELDCLGTFPHPSVSLPYFVRAPFAQATQSWRTTAESRWGKHLRNEQVLEG
ncbi:unnamed protein product, partial [Ectocarpus sp. 12 AP-2014]